MATTRTLYIDSHKASGTGSDFTYFLKQSIQCPENTIAHIDEVLCPNVFLTVNNNRKYLYLSELTVAGASTPRRASVAEGSYSAPDLAAAVQVALNHGTTLVDAAGNATSYTVTYHIHRGTISIYNPSVGSFAFGTTESLLSLGSWAGHNVGMIPADANEVIGLDMSATLTANTLQLNNLVRLLPFQNVYIHSSDFGLPNQSQGPDGQTSIIRRIPVDQAWGNILHSQHMTEGDYINVSGMQMEALSFSLRDVYGRLVDMKGHGISFSIILSAKEIS